MSNPVVEYGALAAPFLLNFIFVIWHIVDAYRLRNDEWEDYLS